MNILNIAGRIGKDAEIRYLQSGDAICNFNVAVDSRVKGEKVTTWVRCTIWGERAEKLAEYLTKGTAVAISGEAKATAYISKQTEEAVAQLEVRVDRLTLLGGGGEKGGQSSGGQRGERAERPQQRQAPPEDFSDDDIPF